MAPRAGLEPTTLRLTAGRSTIELLRSRAGAIEPNHAHQDTSLLIGLRFHQLLPHETITSRAEQGKGDSHLCRDAGPNLQTWRPTGAELYPLKFPCTGDFVPSLLERSLKKVQLQGKETRALGRNRSGRVRMMAGSLGVGPDVRRFKGVSRSHPTTIL